MSLTTVDGSLISSGAITLTTQVTGTLPVANGGTGVATAIDYGFKNRIINGGFPIWQRGTTVTPSLGSLTSYVSDRWVSYQTGAAAAVSKSTGFNGQPNSLSFNGVASNTEVTMFQCIESVNCSDLVGSSIMLSIWLYSTVASKSVSLFIDTANTADTFSATTQVAAVGVSVPASTWTQYTLTYANASSSVANGIRVRVTYGVCTSGTYAMTGVQLEKGSTATSFDYRPYGTELALCQRYYVKTYNQSVVPGAVSSQGALFNYRSGTEVGFTFQFPVNMRTQPSITLYSPNTGTAAKVQVGSTDFTAGVNGGFVGEKNTMAYAVSLSGTTDCYIHMTASAEL